MSEASTQKLLVAMTCALAVALVLIGYGRQRDRSIDRLPLKLSTSAARPASPIASLTRPAASQRIPAIANQSSAQWQSLPETARTHPNSNSAPAREPRARSSFYNQQRPINNYFSESAALESRPPSRSTARHPAAQEIDNHNRRLQQRTVRAAPQPANQQALQTRQSPQFHDFGNVGQAVATRAIPHQDSNVRQAIVESPAPEPDLFTVQKRLARKEASPPAKRVVNPWLLNEFVDPNAIEQTEVTAAPTAPTQEVPQVSQHDIAATIPVPAASPAKMDRRVRKANWTEIEATPKIDPLTNFSPLQQPTLLERRATPQVESAAREQIQYGQSLARRRAYFASREEFIRALLLIASSYNSESNSTAHPERLAQGLIAVDELSDFENVSGSLLQQKILSHKSRLIGPQDIATTSLMQAKGLYSNFAQNQIVQAIGSSQAGSEALHALGKLELMVPEADRNQIKSLVFYRAAIRINPSNAACTNDLGVLLFKMGRLEEAESALIAALKSTQSQLSWNNLALVHRQRAENSTSAEERNRQLSLANLASRQAEKLMAGNQQPATDGLNHNDWATPNEFQNNAAFPNVVIQQPASRSTKDTPTPGDSKSATLKQKLKDWF